MTEPIFGDAIDVVVPAKAPTLWTLALPYVSGPVKIRVQANPAHSWKCGNESCGPGGLFSGSADALVPSAPNGALIAKLGGGDADCPPFLVQGATAVAAPAAAPKMFAIGSYCVFDIKAADSGPLFLTMNDKVSAFANHSGQLTVKVAIAIA